jgi:hypothetical protein
MTENRPEPQESADTGCRTVFCRWGRSVMLKVMALGASLSETREAQPPPPAPADKEHKDPEA